MNWLQRVSAVLTAAGLLCGNPSVAAELPSLNSLKTCAYYQQHRHLVRHWLQFPVSVSHIPEALEDYTRQALQDAIHKMNEDIVAFAPALGAMRHYLRECALPQRTTLIFIHRYKVLLSLHSDATALLPVVTEKETGERLSREAARLLENLQTISAHLDARRL